MPLDPQTKRVPRWYFGGLSSAGATCFTHPLDLLKVQVQTNTTGGISIFELSRSIIMKEGIKGLYSGISASLMRQLTYSTTRFAVYETIKQQKTLKSDGKPLPFYTSVFLAGLGGCTGALAGNPADLVNIRMQSDMKLPQKLRRNYRHGIHGIYEVVTKEGPSKLWTGVSVNCLRSTLATIGQFSFYDAMKRLLLKSSLFKDSVGTHVMASVAAGAIATTLTMPVDVLKTRCMNAKPGELKGICSLLLCTAKEGPCAFFKGYLPAFMRLAPQTILTFVFYEQLRINFGREVN